MEIKRGTIKTETGIINMKEFKGADYISAESYEYNF